MKFRRIFLLPVLAGAISLTAFAQNETVVIRPEPNDEVLVNPGMGITTFQRFNGQPLNQGLRWSEEGPTTKKLFSLAVALDVNRPARAFNWAFQFSSQLIYFMQHAGSGKRK